MPETRVETARDVYAAVNGERKRKGMYWKEITEKTRVAWETMKGWNLRDGARIDCICEVLDALGLEMVIREKRA